MPPQSKGSIISTVSLLNSILLFPKISGRVFKFISVARLDIGRMTRSQE